jgi:hypothetical protein
MAASNQLPQRLNIATNFVTQCQLLANAYSGIQKFNEFYVASGTSYQESDFTNTSLSYIDPASMGTIITELNAFVTWVNAGNLAACMAACNGAS